jgi:hypothetical protein
MRTLTIYKFNELPPESQAKAIEKVRENLREDGHDHFAFNWAIDDCSLFEPAHQEMAGLLGEDYYEQNKNGQYGQFVFKNNRKGILWDEDWSRAQITRALEITNDSMFKTWLGIPERFHKDVDYEICSLGEYSTVLQLSHTLLRDNPISEVLDSLFEKAGSKFESHMGEIGRRISLGIEDYYSDDEMETRIEEGDWEFNEDGSIFG